MPLPLGHAVMGMTTQYLVTQDTSVFKKWRLALTVMFLGILPDIDVLIGLVFWGNGSAIHRGPTHSLAFALVAGFILSRVVQWIPGIPKVSFRNSFLIILSHIVADHFFTSNPVSFFFPFENLMSIGFCGWGDVASSVLYDNIRDAGIIICCLLIIALNMIGRHVYTISAIKMRGLSRDM
jgi:membrane-bound metal-dependent hydrolase YbcI (DUF457 family)